MEYNIRKVCEELWRIEKQYSLFSTSIAGVKFWEIIRMPLYYKITSKLELFGEAHTVKSSLKDKVMAVPYYLYNSLTKNPFFGGTKDILIFDHPRKVLNNGKYVDIYTETLISSFSKDDCDVFETDYLRKHFTDRNQKNRRYLDWFHIRSIPMRFKKVIFTESEINFLTNIETEINKTYNIKINLVDFVFHEIKSFKLKYNSYDKLIKKKKPKKIFLVVSYGNAPLIAAAKSNNVKTIEIQHGVITKYHLGYSFPNQSKVDYFPDEIYSFGEFWKENISYPIEGKNIHLYGFPYFKNKIKKYQNTTKVNNQILFISQGTIGLELSKMLLEIALEMKEYNFIYKLHPGEFDRWKSEYIELVEAEKLENVTIVDNNNKDLHLYLAESEFQVGVNSTALFEGLTLNCKTILVNLPGIDYMQNLITNRYVQLISNKTEFIDGINNPIIKQFKSDEFFNGVNE